jgi:hypothetical protein
VMMMITCIAHDSDDEGLHIHFIHFTPKTPIHTVVR